MNSDRQAEIYDIIRTAKTERPTNASIKMLCDTIEVLLGDLSHMTKERNIYRSIVNAEADEDGP